MTALYEAVNLQRVSSTRMQTDRASAGAVNFGGKLLVISKCGLHTVEKTYRRPFRQASLPGVRDMKDCKCGFATRHVILQEAKLSLV